MGNDLLYQIALTQVPNVGPVQARILAMQFASAKDIFHAPSSWLRNIEGIGEIRAAAIKSFNDFRTAESEVDFIGKQNITPLFLNDVNYPRRLLNCVDAPTLLFYKGTANLNASRIVGIIGTRKNSDYGKQLTEQLIDDLRSQSIIVVSGLAYGIDGIAHRAAIRNAIPTVGVLAHGLDQLYPAKHLSLARQMIETGGLLTEFKSGTNPDRHNFPNRNRIVAGLCDATIVVETGIRGGSIITAELANGYNKDVFAFPGRVNDMRSEGCNLLIKTNKAALVTNANDIIQQMGWEENTGQRRKHQREMFIDLTADEQIIVSLLKEKDSLGIDDLNFRSGLSNSAVAAAMLNLELQNVIQSLPGKIFKLQ